MSLSHDAWQFLNLAVPAGFTAAGAILLEVVRRRVKSVESTVQQVQTTAENVEMLALPTGNGFAKKVLDGLDELRKGQVELNQRLDRHLDDHASAHLRRGA